MSLGFLLAIIGIVLLFLMISVGGLFLISSVGKKRTSYEIDDESLHIYRMLHKIFPTKIQLSDINEVVICHSWLEPHGRRWTVHVRYLDSKHKRFTISDLDYSKNKRPILGSMTGYSTFKGADKARDYFIETLKEHNIHYRIK